MKNNLLYTKYIVNMETKCMTEGINDARTLYDQHGRRPQLSVHLSLLSKG